MQNKIVSLLIAAMVSLSLVATMLNGCSNDASKLEPIKIGAVGPMNYDSGKLIFDGCLIAAEEINGEGGANLGGRKRPLEIIKIDTNEMMSVTDAVAAIEKAIVVEKVNCLIGSNKLESALEEQDKAMDYSTIFISTGNNGAEQSVRVKRDYKRYKYWFRTYINEVDNAYYLNLQAAFIADILGRELGIREPKVAIVADKGSSGDQCVNLWQKSLPQSGMAIVNIFRPSATSTDFNSVIGSLKENGVQIVIQMLTGPAGTAFAREWGKSQVPCVLLGLNVPAQSKSIVEATEGKMEFMATGTLIPNAAITAKTLPFFSKFTEKYKEYPGYGSTSYDAVWIYKNAIEKSVHSIQKPVLLHWKAQILRELLIA